MLPAVDLMRSKGSRESGFGLIEILVAVILVTVALTAVVQAGTSTTVAASRASIRDAQSAILSSAEEKLRADSSWTGTSLDCSSIGRVVDLTGWLQTRLRDELAPDSVRGTAFTIQASAKAIDSPADSRCPDDADGIVPDYYDVQIFVAPDAVTAQRNPDAKPSTVRLQLDFSSRNSGGRLVVQACYVWPQADQRIATGSCSRTGSADVDLLPPTLVPKDVAGAICSSSPSGDCTAWTCANPALDALCSAGQNGDTNFVAVRPIPSSGWSYTVVGDDANTSTEPPRNGVLDDDGYVEIDSMLPGRYKVTVTPPGGITRWDTHSVPQGGIATVEGGVRSRVVQMFRPAHRTGQLRIPIETTDISDPPWLQRTYARCFSCGSHTYGLVPAPLGRTSAQPLSTFKNNDKEIVFPAVEPGLYAAKLVNAKATSYKALQQSLGFFFVPPGDDQPMMLPAQDMLITYNVCRASARNAYVRRYGKGTVIRNPADPSEKWTVEPCPPPSSGSGGAPKPGGGGGGTT